MREIGFTVADDSTAGVGLEHSASKHPAGRGWITGLQHRARMDSGTAEFADNIGVTQSYLSALERGLKEPGATVLLAISQEFGKSVDWLLTGENAPNKKRR